MQYKNISNKILSFKTTRNVGSLEKDSLYFSKKEVIETTLVLNPGAVIYLKDTADFDHKDNEENAIGNKVLTISFNGSLSSEFVSFYKIFNLVDEMKEEIKKGTMVAFK